MIDKIKQLYPFTVAVGSRITCNPAPVDTDADYITLVTKAEYDELVAELFGWPFARGTKYSRSWLQVEGENFSAATYPFGVWHLDGSDLLNQTEHAEGTLKFTSVRQGNDNLIITYCPRFYAKFLDATALAKCLNLLNKQDRVTLFQYVLYGNLPQIRESF